MPSSTALIGSRVVLEPFQPARHLHERYVGWLNDPQNVKFSEQRHRQHTLETCRRYAESFAGTPNHFWAIELKAGPFSGGSDAHIGTMTAYINESHGVGDVGILMGERAVGGRGLATEAWQLACDYLLRVLRLRKVTAGTLAVNLPMLRLMERVGMVEDGRRVAQMLWDGTPVDVVHAALFREAWLARHPNGLVQAAE